MSVRAAPIPKAVPRLHVDNRFMRLVYILGCGPPCAPIQSPESTGAVAAELCDALLARGTLWRPLESCEVGERFLQVPGEAFAKPSSQGLAVQ